jgi:DNA-binding transcriptional LysR family regulator
VAAGFLAKLLGQFRELHPAVDLQITEGRARDTIREVREARLDVAFVVGVPPAGDCHSKPLWREALFIALREGHPLAAAEGVRWPELAGEPFLARSNGAGCHRYMTISCGASPSTGVNLAFSALTLNGTH